MSSVIRHPPSPFETANYLALHLRGASVLPIFLEIPCEENCSKIRFSIARNPFSALLCPDNRPVPFFLLQRSPHIYIWSLPPPLSNRQNNIVCFSPRGIMFNLNPGGGGGGGPYDFGVSFAPPCQLPLTLIPSQAVLSLVICIPPPDPAFTTPTPEPWATKPYPQLRP